MGRCDVCEGGGMRVIEMNFLPDVYVHCEKCNGKRYNRETLEIRYKGKSISDVLDLTVEEAVEFFQNVPYLYRKIKVLAGCRAWIYHIRPIGCDFKWR
jgi:excinuclease ABC subunit A